MMKDELVNEYFEWLYQLVCDEKYSKRLSYRKLLGQLHSIPFSYLVSMDGNRAEDGIDLRYRFGYEQEHEPRLIAVYLDTEPCSVLEMMVALALRCEDHIMTDPDIGDRTGQWFWNMIVSLRLGHMNDTNFDKGIVTNSIQRFLNREYDRNGNGGLFSVKTNQHDMRTEEIWYQMCWYLGEIL